MDKKKPVGSIGWIDLTVDNAAEVRDFYRQVVGWSSTGLDMGGYEDYCMSPPVGTEPVAGVCHARGGNTGLPVQWLIYIIVENLDESLRRCRDLGGEVVGEPRQMGPTSRYCLVKDPAGAYSMLFQE